MEEDVPPQLSGVLPFPDASAPAPAAQLTLSELRGDEVAPVASSSAISATAAAGIEEQAPAVEEKPAESSRAVFGSLSGGASFGAARSSSATRLESALDSTEEAQAAPRSSNFMMIAVCVCLLLAVVIGGGLYFRSQTAGSNAPSLQPDRSPRHSPNKSRRNRPLYRIPHRSPWLAVRWQLPFLPARPP